MRKIFISAVLLLMVICVNAQEQNLNKPPVKTTEATGLVSKSAEPQLPVKTIETGKPVMNTANQKPPVKMSENSGPLMNQSGNGGASPETGKHTFAIAGTSTGGAIGLNKTQQAVTSSSNPVQPQKPVNDSIHQPAPGKH